VAQKVQKQGEPYWILCMW